MNKFQFKQLAGLFNRKARIFHQSLPSFFISHTAIARIKIKTCPVKISEPKCTIYSIEIYIFSAKLNIH